MLWRKYRKYKTFSFPIEKEILKNDKDSNKDITTVCYKTKFIDSARFMVSSLSNFVCNLASNHIKCVYLSHYKCLTQPTLINSHPSE